MAAYKKILEERNAENRQKSERNRRAMIARRNREAQNYVEQEWSSMSALERELQQIEAQLDNEDETPVAGRRKKKNKKCKKKGRRTQQITSSSSSESNSDVELSNDDNDDRSNRDNDEQAQTNDNELPENDNVSPTDDAAVVSSNNQDLTPETNGTFQSEGLYCGPCHKTFRSDAAFDNHVRSRRHIQRVAEANVLPQDGGDEL